ncbi:MAG: conjugal transfer protein TraN [Syntrophales bacterium]|nr:conjugal transfer protein TraN [Syntrophales bacterium]
MGLPQACQAPGSNQCPGNTAPAGSTYRGCWENKVSDDEGGCNAYFYKFQSWYDQIITYICSLTGTSYSALSTCQGSCSQSVACTSTCPSGYTKSGSLCIANASCSSGGTLNTSVDKCQYAPTYNCDSGYTYDSAIGYCKANATCDSSGTLDTSVDKCQLSRIYSCPADYTYNSSIQICQSDPVCDYGYFDSSIDLCRLSASEICPETYTYNSDQNKCLLDPPCPVGAAYSITLNQCSIDAIYDCPDTSEYSPSTRLCWAYPMCPGDMPYNEEINGCDGGYRTCPYGAYPCLPEPETGIKKCSPNECFDPIAAVEDTGEEADTTSYQNDGSIDEATGVCEGIVYIFNGKGGTCKPSGIQTMFFNCCDTSEGSFLMVKKACGEEAGRTVQAIQAGRCHYVGEYCAKKWKFIGCVQTAKTYCCFNSKLGRIIQEQGRGQLQNFQPGGNWGSAESPNCVGFTPEQFSMIDFSRVDLSEFISDIQGQMKTNIEEGVENKINDYYNNY